MTERITPLRQQYLDIKAEYPDCILFFRLGDFYETFDDDAETTARELDLVLTSRPVGRDKRVPMAGVPFHSIDTYVTRLVAKGYKVAVCEPTGEPRVRLTELASCAVTRVIGPGAASDPNAEVTFTDEEIDAMPFGGVLPGAYDGAGLSADGDNCAEIEAAVDDQEAR